MEEANNLVERHEMEVACITWNVNEARPDPSTGAAPLGRRPGEGGLHVRGGAAGDREWRRQPGTGCRQGRPPHQAAGKLLDPKSHAMRARCASNSF